MIGLTLSPMAAFADREAEETKEFTLEQLAANCNDSIWDDYCLVFLTESAMAGNPVGWVLSWIRIDKERKEYKEDRSVLTFEVDRLIPGSEEGWKTISESKPLVYPYTMKQCREIESGYQENASNGIHILDRLFRSSYTKYQAFSQFSDHSESLWYDDLMGYYKIKMRCDRL